MTATSKDGVNFQTHTALMLVDATPLVGNFLDAFVQLSKTCNTPMKYVPLFSDDGHQEWFQSFFHQELTQKFLQDDLKIPGVTRCLCYNKHLAVCCCIVSPRSFWDLISQWVSFGFSLPQAPTRGAKRAHGLQT